MYEAYHPAAFSSIQTIDNQTRWKRTPARQLIQRFPVPVYPAPLVEQHASNPSNCKDDAGAITVTISDAQH